MRRFLNVGPFKSPDEMRAFVGPIKHPPKGFDIVTTVGVHWQQLEEAMPWYVSAKHSAEIYSLPGFPTWKRCIRYYDGSPSEGFLGRVQCLFSRWGDFAPDYFQIIPGSVCPVEFSQCRNWLQEHRPTVTVILELWGDHLYANKESYQDRYITPEELVERIYPYVRLGACDAIAYQCFPEARAFDSLRAFHYLTPLRQAFPDLPLAVEGLSVKDLGAASYLLVHLPGLSFSAVSMLGLTHLHPFFDFEFMLVEIQTMLNAHAMLGFGW